MITAHGPVYTADEEHLLRRIGTAVALHWRRIPQGTAEMILDQAALVSDREDVVQVREQLEMFLEGYAARSDAA